MAKKYVVDLKEVEQALLNEMMMSGTQRVRKTNHARVLLKAHDGWSDDKISEALNISVATIERIRQRFVEEGIELALKSRQIKRKYQTLMDGVQEAYLITLACGQPPTGFREWSLRLLASEMVRLEFIPRPNRGYQRNWENACNWVFSDIFRNQNRTWTAPVQPRGVNARLALAAHHVVGDLV